MISLVVGIGDSRKIARAVVYVTGPVPSAIDDFGDAILTPGELETHGLVLVDDLGELQLGAGRILIVEEKAVLIGLAGHAAVFVEELTHSVFLADPMVVLELQGLETELRGHQQLAVRYRDIH